MTASGRPSLRASHRRRADRRWTAAACFLLLWASFSARHHGQQEDSPELTIWRLTLPTTPTFPSVWTLSDAPGPNPRRPPELDAEAVEADLRARLAALVKNGRLMPSTDGGSAARTVTFRPWRRGEVPPAPNADPAAPATAPAEPIKPPGPLEDAALAAAVRSRVAADPELGKRSIAVTCQAGCVTLRAPAVPTSGGGLSWEHTAALVDLALAVEPIVCVQVDLPEPPPAGNP